MKLQRWIPGLVAAVLAVAGGVVGGEESEGWTDLFDGKSLENWRGYQKEDVPASWEVRDGSLYCNGKDDAHL